MQLMSLNEIMETKIQLQHPEGKKAVSMDPDKYRILKEALINILKTRGEATHDEILQAVNDEFNKNCTKFEGSVEWHLEWVKLDLEARKEIRRTRAKNPVRYALGG